MWVEVRVSGSPSLVTGRDWPRFLESSATFDLLIGFEHDGCDEYSAAAFGWGGPDDFSRMHG
jgi:hypothetical protein